jgi:serine/threonine protein kinase
MGRHLDELKKVTADIWRSESVLNKVLFLGIRSRSRERRVAEADAESTPNWWPAWKEAGADDMWVPSASDRDRTPSPSLLLSDLQVSRSSPGLRATNDLTHDVNFGSTATCRESAWSDDDVEAVFSAARTGDASYLQSVTLACFPCLAKVKSLDDWTPLHFAADNGQAKCAQVLVDSRADLAAETSSGRTALHVAAQRGHAEVCAVLLAKSANARAATCEGSTALHLAAAGGHREVVQQLLRECPDAQTDKDNCGRIAAEVAVDGETVVLFDAAALKDTYGRTLFGGTLRRTSRADHVQALLYRTQYVPLGRAPGRKSALTVGNQSQDARKTRRSFVALREESALANPGLKGFVPVRLIGQGNFGAVYKVKKAGTNRVFAMKVQEKAKLIDNKLIDYSITERNILSYTDHPFIVKMYYAFQTGAHLALVLEYCEGGDLHELIKRYRRLPTDLTTHYAAEVFLALEYLHARNVLYRDLKPENVVLKEGHCKLADFGLSKESKNGTGMSFCGSAAYLSPEMLSKQLYTWSVDLYALGVLAYETANGKTPFVGKTREELFGKIQTAEISFHDDHDPVLRSFIEALMERDLSKRLGAKHTADVRQHPLFSSLDLEGIANLTVPLPEFPLNTPTPAWAGPFRRNAAKARPTPQTGALPFIERWSYVCPTAVGSGGVGVGVASELEGFQSGFLDADRGM